MTHAPMTQQTTSNQLADNLLVISTALLSATHGLPFVQ
jgi:hypothetical protein